MVITTPTLPKKKKKKKKPPKKKKKKDPRKNLSIVKGSWDYQIKLSQLNEIEKQKEKKKEKTPKNINKRGGVVDARKGPRRQRI